MNFKCNDLEINDKPNIDKRDDIFDCFLLYLTNSRRFNFYLAFQKKKTKQKQMKYHIGKYNSNI